MIQVKNQMFLFHGGIRRNCNANLLVNWLFYCKNVVLVVLEEDTRLFFLFFRIAMITDNIKEARNKSMYKRVRSNPIEQYALAVSENKIDLEQSIAALYVM